MMNRRTFLKLSAGALALAAAGALTGCGGTPIDLDHPNKTVDGVTFLCDTWTGDTSGGEGKQAQYKPYFAIWNQTDAPVEIPATDITGTFTDEDGHSTPMRFGSGNLKLNAKQYVVYNSATFCLDTENSITPSCKKGKYEIRIVYNKQTVAFRYDGESVTVA